MFTVPGDALAGTAAAGGRPGPRTAAAIGASVCLYEAGMALNDWADRDEDAVERPHRPVPSGRIAPAAALGAATALTLAGLGLAARAGRPATAVAAALTAAVWSYDLGLKRTPAGPAVMGAARGLDLLLGAAASTGRIRPALPSAAALAAHTTAVTTVSRRETEGGSSLAPLGALAVTGAVAGAVGVARRRAGPTAGSGDPGTGLRAAAAALLSTAYAATAARPLLHAALNPSPQLTQRAVGAGIRATVPLQSALTARAGSPLTAAATAALAPLARRFARRVSIT